MINMWGKNQPIQVIFFLCIVFFVLGTVKDVSAFCGVSIEVLETTSITDHSATLHANYSGYIGSCDPINIEGLFDYGLSSGNYSLTCNSGEGGIGEFSCDITGLDAETTYYFVPYIYVYDSANTYGGSHYTYFHGSESSFTTSGGIVVTPPTLSASTPAPTNITPTTAQGNGEITATGGEDPERFIEWGTVSGMYTDSCTAGIGGVGTYSCTMTPLLPGTIYYVRAYATNSAGTNYSTETSFTSAQPSQDANQNISATIQETMTLSCGADIDLDNATPLIPGIPQSNTTTCTVTTNDAEGYNLSIADDRGSSNTLYHATLSASPDGQIQDKTPWDPTGSGNAQAWTGDGMGFGILSSEATKNSTWWGTGNTCDDTNQLYAGFPNTDQNILEHTSYTNTATDTEICYRINVPSTQIAGEYTGSVTYTATGRP